MLAVAYMEQSFRYNMFVKGKDVDSCVIQACTVLNCVYEPTLIPGTRRRRDCWEPYMSKRNIQTVQTHFSGRHYLQAGTSHRARVHIAEHPVAKTGSNAGLAKFFSGFSSSMQYKPSTHQTGHIKSFVSVQVFCHPAPHHLIPMSSTKVQHQAAEVAFPACCCYRCTCCRCCGCECC